MVCGNFNSVYESTCTLMPCTVALNKFITERSILLRIFIVFALFMMASHEHILILWSANVYLNLVKPTLWYNMPVLDCIIMLAGEQSCKLPAGLFLSPV